MRPFDFVILLFSFVYTLGLTHLLTGTTAMIRNRHSLVFSWPHALWMTNALSLLGCNWLSLWDFRNMSVIPIGTVAIGFVYVILQYLICGLVTPDFEGADGYDMRAFYDKNHRTYVLAFLVFVVLSLAVNAASGSIGVQNWAQQNVIVGLMLIPTVAPLVMKNAVVEIAAPTILAALSIAYMVTYYPALR